MCRGREQSHFKNKHVLLISVKAPLVILELFLQRMVVFAKTGTGVAKSDVN